MLGEELEQEANMCYCLFPLNQKSAKTCSNSKAKLRETNKVIQTEQIKLIKLMCPNNTSLSSQLFTFIEAFQCQQCCFTLSLLPRGD